MKNIKYIKLWLIFVNIKAQKNLNFNELIDVSDINKKTEKKFIGAWANLIIKADNINESIEIASLGLNELGFKIEFIDKIENILSLVESKELKNDVIKEANWLLKSKFVFKISDRIFPYTSIE
jgi:hypothetical protein